MVLDISKVFDRVGNAALLHKVKSYGISGRVLALFHLFPVKNGFRWFWMFSQGYPVNAKVLQGFILGPIFCLIHINDLPDDVICNIAV